MSDEILPFGSAYPPYPLSAGQKRRMARRRKQREEARRKEKSLKTSHSIYPLEATELLEEADAVLIAEAEALLDNLSHVTSL